MKVMIMGSYRARENGFNPGRWDYFKNASQKMGQILAQEGYTLVIPWSYNNIFSQLGAKDRIRNNPRSHPYWETADYQALIGFVQALKVNKSLHASPIIQIVLFGSDPEFDNEYPFPHPKIIDDKVTKYISPNAVGEAGLELFDEKNWVDVSELINSGWVVLHPRLRTQEMRLEALTRLIREVDAIIVLGGGKATRYALSDKAVSTTKRVFPVVLVPAPFCAGGAFCKLELELIEEYPNLKQVLHKLIVSTEQRFLVEVVSKLIVQLPALVEALIPPRVVIITIRDDEFQGVYCHLDRRSEWVGKLRTYQTGVLLLENGEELRVSVIRTDEQGEISAQQTTNNAISDLKPDLVILCGIAGQVATSDLTLGDVVVANRYYYMGTGAIKVDGRQYTVQGGPVLPKAQDLINKIEGLSFDDRLGNWNSDDEIRVTQPNVQINKDSFQSDDVKRAFMTKFDCIDKRKALYRRKCRDPKIFVGAVGGDGNLIKTLDLIEEWKKFVRDLIAIEMESGGVYRACFENNVNFICFRSISDMVGLKRDDAWTKYAAFVAGSFCCSFLRTLRLDELDFNS